MLLLPGPTCHHPLNVLVYTIRKCTGNTISHSRSHHHCLKMQLYLLLLLPLLTFFPRALWCSDVCKQRHNEPSPTSFPIITQPSSPMLTKHPLKMANFLHLCYYNQSPDGHHHLVPTVATNASSFSTMWPMISTCLCVCARAHVHVCVGEDMSRPEISTGFLPRWPST